MALATEVFAALVASRLPPPRVFASYTIQRQAQLIGEQDAVDIALMGTSLVGAGISPDLLSAESDGAPTAFNAAVGGGGPLLLEQWASDLVIPVLRPQLVVVGIGPRDSNDNFSGPERTLADYMTSKGRERLVGDSDWLGTADEFLEANLGIFGLRTAYREPASAAAYLINGSGSWRRATDDTGRIVFFDDRTFTTDSTITPLPPDDPLADYSVGSRNLPAVGRAIDVLQHSGICVVLVDMPRVEGPLEDAIGEDGIAEYEAEMEGLASEFGVQLLQGDQWIRDPSMFADRHHLNATGTQQFTMALAEQLEPCS